MTSGVVGWMGLSSNICFASCFNDFMLNRFASLQTHSLFDSDLMGSFIGALDTYTKDSFNCLAHSISYSTNSDFDYCISFKYERSEEHPRLLSILITEKDFNLKDDRNKELLETLVEESPEINNFYGLTLQKVIEKKKFKEKYEHYCNNGMLDEEKYTPTPFALYSYRYLKDNIIEFLSEEGPLKINLKKGVKREDAEDIIIEIDKNKTPTFFKREVQKEFLTNLIIVVNNIHQELYLNNGEEQEEGLSVLTMYAPENNYYQIIEYKHVSRIENNYDGLGVILKIEPNGEQTIQEIVEKNKRLKEKFKFVRKTLE